MFHLKPGSDFRTDLSAVMLADGKWYSVYDPTLPNGGEYLSFLQYPDGRDQRAVMVNVSLTDIKAVAYYGLPTPDLPVLRDLKAGRIYALPDDDAVGPVTSQLIVVAGTVDDAREIARSVPGATVPVSPRSIRHGALRGRTSTGVVIDASVHPLDRDLLDELLPTMAGGVDNWWIRRVAGTGENARWNLDQWNPDE